MKRQIAVSLFILFAVTTLLFAHAGEVHSYMGTITSLREDGSFVLEKTDGETMHVHVVKTTTYLHADGRAASASDLTVGSRVVAKIAKDGKTALSIRVSPKS